MPKPAAVLRQGLNRDDIAKLVARCTLVTAVAVSFYVFSPNRDVSSINVALRLIAAALIYLAAIAWQMRLVFVAERPTLRAAEAVYTAIVALIVFFANIYVTMSESDPAAFNQPLDKPAGVYFTTTVLATVGFGDIAPQTTSARMVVMSQMVLNLIVIGVIARSLFGAASKSKEHRAAANS
jgi:hypothetical protein